MLHMDMEKKKKLCAVTRVTIGFRTDYQHFKVTAENKNKVLCQLLSSGYMCVLGSSIVAFQQF